MIRFEFKMSLGQDITVSLRNYLGFRHLECRDAVWAGDIDSGAICCSTEQYHTPSPGGI